MYTEHSTECMNICLNMACSQMVTKCKSPAKECRAHSVLDGDWMSNEVFIRRKKYAQQTLSLTLNLERIMHAYVDHLYILKSMMGKNIF